MSIGDRQSMVQIVPGMGLQSPLPVERESGRTKRGGGYSGQPGGGALSRSVGTASIVQHPVVRFNLNSIGGCAAH